MFLPSATVLSRAVRRVHASSALLVGGGSATGGSVCRGARRVHASSALLEGRLNDMTPDDPAFMKRFGGAGAALPDFVEKWSPEMFRRCGVAGGVAVSGARKRRRLDAAVKVRSRG